MEKEYLTADEVAEYFKIAHSTLRQWQKRGILHPIYVTGRIRMFDRKEILHLIEQLKGRKHPLSDKIKKRGQK